MHGNASNIVWRACAMKWLQYFPPDEYEFRLWSDAQGGDFVRLHCERHWDMYRNAPSTIHQSDLLRYCLLYQLGGIYADLDYEPRANFWDELAIGRVSVIGSPYANEKIENALMASSAGNEYWTKVLDLAKSRGINGPPVSFTGPKLLRALPDTLNATFAHILPCERFFRPTHMDDPCFSSKQALASASHKKPPLSKKMCPCQQPLHGNHSRDSTLMGVHWGTFTYWCAQGKPGCPPGQIGRLFRIKSTFKAFHNMTTIEDRAT